jgi:hypothetical protein
MIFYTNFLCSAAFVLDCSLLSSGIPYSGLQRVTIPDTVIIQFVLLNMGMLMLETCRVYRTAFTESDDTRCCDTTICPPEDGHVDARNMSRIVM